MALCVLRFRGGGEMEGSWSSATRLLAFFAAAGFEDAMFNFHGPTRPSGTDAGSVNLSALFEVPSQQT